MHQDRKIDAEGDLGSNRPFVSESPLLNAGKSTRKLDVAGIHVHVEGGGYHFG
jgi:hypothetical protein